MTKQTVDTRDIKASVYGVAVQEKDARKAFGADRTENPVKRLSWKASEPGKRYRVFAGVKKEGGEHVSYCLNLPGAVSCGDSRDKAVENLREAVAGCIKSYLDAGKQIPWIKPLGSKDEYDFTEWIDVDV